MKTATISFHASHNYGSMLQAFALQQTIKHLGFDNQLINLRTIRHRILYPIYPQVRPLDSFQDIIKFTLKWTVYLKYRKDCVAKYELFEQFLRNKLDVTDEYVTIEQFLEKKQSYDCYIAGGDQIWNTAAFDFDWSFFLPFVKSGKRISYAVSMGRDPHFSEQQRSLIQNYLSKFDVLSVREEGTKNIVESLVSKKVSQVLDPAFLLTKEQWKKHIGNEPIVEGKYILIYSPRYNKEVYDIASSLSRKLGIPVVNTIYIWKMLKYRFNHKLDVGPLEFVNLVANASLVVSGSFHALVFSAIFNIPFWAVNGEKDNRMITFLKTMEFQDRTINISDWKSKADRSFDCDFTASNQCIYEQRLSSIDYLYKAISQNEE